MKVNPPEDYYSSISSRMNKEFDAIFIHAKAALSDHFGISKIAELESRSKSKYQELLPTLPYIGGKKNPETINVIMGAIVVSIVHPLTSTELERHEIGRVIHHSFEGYFQSRPRFIQKILGRIVSSPYTVRRMKKQIEKDVFADYENNFKLENVESEEGEFDFGYNYTACALCKLFSDNKLEGYLKYVCLGDHALFRSLGVGFTRTQTIAHGAPSCDFRFTKKGTTPQSWPPEALEEWVS